MTFVSLRNQKNFSIKSCGQEERGAREEEKEDGGAGKVPHTHLELLEAFPGTGSEVETTGMIQGDCV